MLEHMSDVFFQEAAELLEQLEHRLLELEDNSEDQEIISAVFRIMHTIKGSSGMFGFDDISKFTHEVETTFDYVRNGALKVTPELITLTLAARDHINHLLKGEITEEQMVASQEIINKFKKLSGFIAQADEDVILAEHKDVPNPNAKKNDETYHIIFIPSADIMNNGTKPNKLIQELAGLGFSTVSVFLGKVPELSIIEPEKCYISWDVILTTKEQKDAIEDVFIFLDSDTVIKVEHLDVEQAEKRRLGEILAERGAANSDEIDNIINQQKKLGEILVEKHVVEPEQLASALEEQKHIQTINKAKAEVSSNQSIRVSSEKLDQLIDLVGELVTFNARLDQWSEELNDSQFVTLCEHGAQLILSLRDTTMEMRMLPIGTIFSRFRRLVRDLSVSMNKEIELITEGAETELDKTVIEKLQDPLVHLIRNSCDHGIETPDVRKAAGKPPQGVVTLSAKHAGAFVIITIKDDGAGLNLEKIREKAIEKGLIASNAEIPEQELCEMIFHPGFSTSDTVTSVSGRGVGMDVVKKDITALGGTAYIETKKGLGSSFILKLPLTLAIIEGMMVKIAENFYVVPLGNVMECLELKKEQYENKLCSYIDSRGTFLPYINMRNWFGIEEKETPDVQQIVVVTDQDSKIGIVVDRVVGNYQTVIKPLGKLYKNIAGFSGATILGNGSVALILDIYKLSAVVRKEDTKKSMKGFIKNV